MGFRYTCMNEGKNLGLSGWVRNTPSGDVEVWAEGTEEKLEAFMRWLHRGPPGARVDMVHRETRLPTGCYRRFGIEY